MSDKNETKSASKCLPSSSLPEKSIYAGVLNVDESSKRITQFFFGTRYKLNRLNFVCCY